MGIVHLNTHSTPPWVQGPEAECGGVAEVQLLFAVDVDKSWRGRWAHHYQGGMEVGALTPVGEGL